MTKLRAALRRWFWLLLVGATLGAVVGAASLTLRTESTPDYQATSVILFDIDRSSSASLQAAQQAGLRVQRGTVPLRAAQILGEGDPEALARALAVDVDGDSLSLRIQATDEDPERAAAISNAFADAFLETSNEQELAALDEQILLLERQIEVAQQRLEAFDAANPLVASLTDTAVPLVRERSDLLAEVTQFTQDLDDTTQRRDTTTGPYSRLGEPNVALASGGVLTLPSQPVLRVGLLAALGFAMAALLIALIERWNPRIDTKNEAEEATQLPVLTMVPYLGRRARPRSEVVDPEHFGGGHAESYRRLRSAIQFVSSTADDGHTAPVRSTPTQGASFLVVSSSPGEGKTSTVSFASFALAESDVPTLAVNADCRRPTLHRRLGVGSEPGLTELAAYALDRPKVDDVVQAGPIDDLWVVSSGRAGPLTNDLVAAVGEVVDTATSRGATVVIDSSPLLATTDAMELVPLVDHVVFVIRTGRTTRKEALEGLEMLRLRGAPLLGCVCVGSPATKRRYSYYENYYYGSSAKRTPSEPAAPGPAERDRWSTPSGADLPVTPVADVAASSAVGRQQPPPYRSPVTGDTA